MKRALFVTMILLLFSVTGCEKEATPEAAIHQGAQTRDDAKALQAESQKRLDDGNKILDGK